MKKLLISGGKGKLATQIIKHNTEYDIFAPPKQEMDIIKYEDIERYILKYNPDIFLHAAAYTRPIKKHQDNPDISLRTNILGTCNVVLTCMKHNIKLVYISTDYVYPGIRGNYKENDPVSPYGIKNDGMTKYGWSKLGGEAAVKLCDSSLILRLCMSNKPFPHPKAAIDIRKSYLYEDDAAKLVLKLLDQNGIINVGGPPSSVYEFAVKDNSNIGKIKASEIKDVTIAPDTTMDITKMEGILEQP